ncbi:hypothetical protein INT44_000190 [Umbelopsis vinacea]|uniref:THAP4-like heme-binding domain-containing protein n=1 Tax=Umbelopsis vinacea TaxID=44442 RepID=A0A8H7PIV4_9FUNG|nr:hypothetical protein INT44_000190 [Umbelopsis vinacea]
MDIDFRSSNVCSGSSSLALDWLLFHLHVSETLETTVFYSGREAQGHSNGRARSSTKLSVWDVEGNRKRLFFTVSAFLHSAGIVTFTMLTPGFKVSTPLSVLLSTRKRYRSLHRRKGSWAIRKQRSWTLDEVKKPLHVETGYVRVPSPKKVEMVISQPTGVVSVEEGTIDGTVIQVETISLARTSSAKAPHVTKFARRFKVNVEDGTLHSTMGMATEATDLTQHLESTLKRID